MKNRILILLITWLSVFFIGYKYKEILFFILLKSNITIHYFIVTNVTEVFLTYFKFNQLLANYFFIFYFCYHSFLFFVTGLYYVEYSSLKHFIFVGLINLVCFILFIGFLGIPIVWTFFFKSQQIVSDQIIPLYFETKLQEFLFFYESFFHLTILNAFFFTILTFFSIYVNKNLFLLKINRKVFHLFLLIIVIVLTPSDIFSFISVGSILIFIFELFIFLNFLKI
jgi:Sec-independent protein translocase protein (TatC)